MWITVMIILAPLLGHDFYFTILWAFVILCYCVLPWHAMFSAIHGMPFDREDKPYVQWMQHFAKWVVWMLPYRDTKQFWQWAGIVYGAVRGMPAALASLSIYGYTDLISSLWLAFAFLNMGTVYYVAGYISRVINKPKWPVAIGEFIMGCILGWFLW